MASLAALALADDERLERTGKASFGVLNGHE